jgi:hypothetical protein
VETIEIRFDGTRDLKEIYGRLQTLPFKVVLSDGFISIENKKENARCYLQFGDRTATSGTRLDIDYRSVEMVKAVIVSILGSEQRDATIDLDFGEVLGKVEMLERVKREPSWDWRDSSGL